MADVRVGSVYTQFGYEGSPSQKVGSVYTQFSYENPPLLKVGSVFVQFAYVQKEDEGNLFFCHA